MLCYCKKCGRIAQEAYNKNEQICDYCSNIMQYIPDEFLVGKRKCIFKDELKNQFIDEYIKSSPEFDQYLFEHREEDMFNKRMSDRAKMAHGKAILEEQSRRITCSYCGSSNVKKIGLLNRAVSTELWGLGSKKIGKQWHCNNCGSDF